MIELTIKCKEVELQSCPAFGCLVRRSDPHATWATDWVPSRYLSEEHQYWVREQVSEWATVLPGISTPVNSWLSWSRPGLPKAYRESLLASLSK